MATAFDEKPPGVNLRNGSNVGGIAGEQLRTIIDRIERLTEEKKALNEDIKDIFAEAKGNGFDNKIIRKILALRKRDANEVAEEVTMLDLYLRALGMKSSDDDTRTY